MATNFNSNETYVVVNGVSMTIKEWRQYKREKNGKPKKRTPKVTTYSLITDETTAMMKSVAVLKSIVAYNENAYKQWGTIANTILEAKHIRKPFTGVVSLTKDCIELYDKITNLAKKKDRDVFQFVEKLGWKFDDLRTELEKLTDGIRESDVLRQFNTHECVNGTGRRLGLRVLTRRSYKATDDLLKICKRLDEIVSKGVDAFEYRA